MGPKCIFFPRFGAYSELYSIIPPFKANIFDYTRNTPGLIQSCCNGQISNMKELVLMKCTANLSKI